MGRIKIKFRNNYGEFKVISKYVLMKYGIVYSMTIETSGYNGK